MSCQRVSRCGLFSFKPYSIYLVYLSTFRVLLEPKLDCRTRHVPEGQSGEVVRYWQSSDGDGDKRQTSGCVSLRAKRMRGEIKSRGGPVPCMVAASLICLIEKWD